MLKLHKVPKLFEMENFHLTENGLKLTKCKSWTFYRCKGTIIPQSQTPDHVSI